MSPTFALTLLFGAAAVGGSHSATFHVPFEISFRDCNPFGFTVHHLDSFLAATSSFFVVEAANVTVAFIKEVSAGIVDVGFTVSVDSFQEEERIQSLSVDLFPSYRAHLDSARSLGLESQIIIGLESKHKACPASKYPSFYHYDVECLWLCDHHTVYLNDTNRCRPTANMTSTERVAESHSAYLPFVGVGYASSALLTAAVALLISLKTLVERRQPADQETLHSDTETSGARAKRRGSIYKYHPETEDEDQSKRIELSVNSPTAERKANPEDVALSVGDGDRKRAEDTDSDGAEVFVLEEVECAESHKARKSQIIEQSRRASKDLLDEFKRLGLALKENGKRPPGDAERDELDTKLSEIKKGAVKQLRMLKAE